MAACRIDRLDALKSIAGNAAGVTTNGVMVEMDNHGVGDVVRNLGWPEIHPLDELDELTALGRWTQIVGTQGPYNFGEATVLAWAEVHEAIAVIDDREACLVAGQHGQPVHGTLWLFAEAIKEGRETQQSLEGLVDGLVNGGLARYPFKRGSDFGRWAQENKLLP